MKGLWIDLAAVTALLVIVRLSTWFLGYGENMQDGVAFATALVLMTSFVVAKGQWNLLTDAEFYVSVAPLCFQISENRFVAFWVTMVMFVAGLLITIQATVRVWDIVPRAWLQECFIFACPWGLLAGLAALSHHLPSWTLPVAVAFDLTVKYVIAASCDKRSVQKSKLLWR